MTGSLINTLLLSTWLLPLLLSVLVLAGWRWSVVLAPLAALPAVVLATIAHWTQAQWSLSLPWLLLGSQFGVDAVARIFLLASSVLWLCSGLYAHYYLQDYSKRVRFTVFFLLAMAGNFGLILAQDTIGFFTFFALMSIAAYGLVIHDASAVAVAAGRVYISLVIASEVSLWSALVLISRQSPALEFSQLLLFSSADDASYTITVLVLLGLGIKAGLLGLHVWLPLAHSVAPTPASAVLSGAMIKAGLLGWLRLLPLGEVALVSVGAWVLAAGISAVFLAVVAGCLQRNPKTVLAYSSVSQMGLMIAIVGVGLMAPHYWPSLLTVLFIYIVHHALIKGSLFLGIGVIRHQCKPQWLHYAVMTALALTLAGAPLSSGMIAKAALKQALEGAVDFQWLLNAIVMSSVATGLLMSRCLCLLWLEQRQLTPARHTAACAPHSPACSLGLLLPWWACIGVSVCLVWRFPLAVDVMSTALLWSAAWPCIIVIMITATVWWLATFKPVAAVLSHRFVQVPPGDVLIPLCWLINQFAKSLRAITLHYLPRWLSHCQRVLVIEYRTWFEQGLSHGERSLLQWPVATLLLLLLVVCLIIAALLT